MRSTSELTPGTQLAGYTILQLVGRGGTGLVYEAEHVVLGRRAALKTLVPDLVDDAEFRERLTRESRMVAALDHPAVIPIYDAGESDGILYVAMRFVRGGDLADLLTRDRRLDVETTAGVLEQVAGALDSAHAHGLVHRDVKPANVLLEEATGRVYLSDFGIAKQADSAGLTKTGFFLGTVDSAAPEQIQGQAVGPPADVYAFGCTLYECLTGHPPFERSNAAATLRAHLFEDPPPLPPALDLPEAVDDVIARALAKEEASRYAACGDVVAELRAAVGISRHTRAWTALRQAPAVRTGQVAALPQPTKPLFGREQELERLDGLLRRRETRLVSLVGLGGTGKTRLALAAAHSVADDFDEVAFADLASLDDPEACVRAVVEAVGEELPDGASAIDVLTARLAGKRALLVLDGFEHLLGAAPLLAELPPALPETVALVTTQASLRLGQEQRLPVPPLPLPDPEDRDDLDRLSLSPAVALFVDQALAVRPDFELTSENAEAVVGICNRLDGLPLAIELAAARLDLLPPQAILDRLDQRLDFLTEGAPGLPERHQTLRRALDRTHDLLPEHERDLFARLGVFSGAWSLEAAEAVCGEPERSGGGELLRALGSLVDKGLVRPAEAAEGEPRFRMLGTVREYALERLVESGELAELRRRHARRYLALAEAAEPELTGTGQLVWIRRLSGEEEDIWAALDWALHGDGDLETGLRLASALARFWAIRGPVAPARRWFEEALEASGEIADHLRYKARSAAGWMTFCQGEFGPAGAQFEQSLEIARSLGDATAEGEALAQLARIRLATGEPAPARGAAEQALTLADAAADKVTASYACSVLSELAAGEDDEPGAAALSERALRLRRELGDRSLLARSFVDLARRRLPGRDHAETAALLHEGLDLARQVGDTGVEALAMSTLGALAAGKGDGAAGRRHLAEALTTAYRRGDARTVAECVHGLAAVAALGGDSHRAARLLGAAQALRQAQQAELSPVERALDELLGSTQVVPDAALEVEQAAGGLLQLDDVVGLALGEG
jgi:predicted ATPase/tRNA A-37 threonylcarbamoyl transferase component Bud32